MRRFGALVFLFGLLSATGCSKPAIDGPPVVKPTPSPQPVALSVARDGDGYRLEASAGNQAYATWVDSGHLLVSADEPGRIGQDTTFLVDLIRLSATPVLTAPGQSLYVVPGGDQVVITSGWQTTHVDLKSGEAQTVLSGDAAAVQWAERGMIDASKSFSNHVTWVSEQAFILTLDGGVQSLSPWGKLLLADTAARTVVPLAQQGQVAAVLPDGRFLVREGWVDGPIKVYDGAAATAVTEGGPWTWGFQVSPDGKAVAWFELEAPPGDWSKRIPKACCSGDPHPKVKGVTVWRADTGKVVRHPVVAARWPQNLAWRKDGSALLYYRLNESRGTTTTEIYQLQLSSGTVTQLARNEWSGYVTFITEGPDVTLYYSISGRTGQNPVDIIRLRPDGKQETLISEELPTWNYDQQRRLVYRSEEGTRIVDLVTGKEIRMTPAGDLSPDQRWAAQWGGEAEPRVIRIRPTTQH